MSDFTRLTRSDWLDLADRFYRRLDETCAGLTAAAWERPTSYLGWRARDVLAHMTSAMPVNFREVLRRALADNPAAPPEFDTFTRVTSLAWALARRRIRLGGDRGRATRLEPDAGHRDVRNSPAHRPRPRSWHSSPRRRR